MKHKTTRDTMGSSPLVRRYASRIADAAQGLPILDVACGSGRNAMLLSELGCTVVCIDKDLTRLKVELESRASRFTSQLHLHHLDLVKDPWPFDAGTVGGIINVHFLLPALFPCFEKSVAPGGCLLLESVPGCGGNYIELPSAGKVKSALQNAFDFEFYKERKIGPPGVDAVTVKLFARRSEKM